MLNSKVNVILLAILLITISLGIFLFYNTFIKQEGIEETAVPKQSNSKTSINNQNNVEFQVTPLSTTEFQIEINTHSVELDFDLTQISTLFDDLGNVYKPLEWQGSSSGGHHRSGILKFPSINKNAKSIKLVIVDNTQREFMWKLR